MERLHKLPQEPRNILIDHVIDTSLGMARWQEHGPYVADEEEMDDYMLQVAGRVGFLLTDIFAWHTPSIEKLKRKLMPLAREFGLALQTVNIIRGMRKDYERGWVFVPVTFYEEAGLTREGLFDPLNSDPSLRVVGMLADKAERHLRNGLSYTTLLPRTQRHIRLFCLWPLLFAVKTLAISRHNYNVLAAEAKITRNQVERIMFVSKLFSWSNFCLTTYYNSLFKPSTAYSNL
jgi:farnesyl-diphosphate farnesyltransferase